MTGLTETERLLLPYYKNIGGIDEAGRGPLAGPVSAACVILDLCNIPDGINDSKKLSEKRREALFEQITTTAHTSVSLVSEKTVDEINILNATKLAMRNAVAGLDIVPDFILIDGNFVIGAIKNEKSVIGGDALCVSIAAASIIAKVTRDRYMCELDEKYPEYGFKKHKGYGTREHYEAILKYGPCPAHRKSFLKNLYGGEK